MRYGADASHPDVDVQLDEDHSQDFWSLKKLAKIVRSRKGGEEVARDGHRGPTPHDRDDWETDAIDKVEE